jgi:hypothetical protein
MFRSVRFVALGAVFAACLVAIACQRRSVEQADLVLVNGRVLTVDPNVTVAEAIAVSGGKIVAVGSGAQIQSRVGDRIARFRYPIPAGRRSRAATLLCSESASRSNPMKHKSWARSSSGTPMDSAAGGSSSS